jgi:hypothetical protein
MFPIGSSSLRLLNQSTHSSVANSTCSKLRHGPQSTPDHSAEDTIPIANEVARNLIPRERLCYLARNPFRCRMSCDVDPDKSSAVEPRNDEGVEQVEANRWDDEHIRRWRHPGYDRPERRAIPGLAAAVA